MKLIKTTPSNLVKIKNLKCGDCFYYPENPNVIYLLTNENEDPSNKIAVTLTEHKYENITYKSGQLDSLHVDHLVTPCDPKLVID